VAYETLKVISICHTNNMVHGDIKLSNLMLLQVRLGLGHCLSLCGAARVCSHTLGCPMRHSFCAETCKCCSGAGGAGVLCLCRSDRMLGVCRQWVQTGAGALLKF